MTRKSSTRKLRVGLVVPHIFMHEAVLPHVIFSPAQLALDLASGLQELGADVTLFSPGPVSTSAHNITADLALFEAELALRGDGYTDLLRKHPLTFITLARQIQAELIATAYAMANNDQLDIVHIYTNEEDIALPFAQFCSKPVVLTHHDPFNFLVKHKSVFPKYKHLNWIAISEAQKASMPPDTTWAGTVHHGVAKSMFALQKNPTQDYLAYFGRIIPQKGVHLAIAAVRAYNKTAKQPLPLKIAGKHYASHAKDTYWRNVIEPQLGEDIQYVGHLSDASDKQDFLGNAAAVIMPSLFDEPFGMVAIEAMACGTPVVGLNSGAIGEVVKEGVTGTVVHPHYTDAGVDEPQATVQLANAIPEAIRFDRAACRHYFEQHFTARQMCQNYLAVYQKLAAA